MNKGLDMKPFARRVRVVRAWRGLAVGLLIGGAMGLVWSVLDWTGAFFTDWLDLGVLFVAVGVVGAIVGAVWPVRESAVAKSVDRRAALRDRVSTSIERKDGHESFDEALHEDAAARVAGLRARTVYPLRIGRWQYSSLAMVALASLIFLLGNSWYVLSPEARKTKEELTKIAAQIDRVAKPLLEKKGLTEDEKKLGNELRDFARRLEKGRINREEGMKRANELAKQAEKLAQDRVQKTMKSMQTAREQMTRAELASKGLDEQSLEKLNMDQKQRELLNQLQQELGQQSQGDDTFSQDAMEQLGLQNTDSTLLNLTKEQRDALKDLLQKKLDELEKQLQNSQSLTQDELKQLLDQKAQMQKMQQQLQMSEEMRKALEEFMNSPEFKDIMKAVDKLRDAAQQVQNGQPLTQKQIKDLEQMLDDLDKKIQNSKYHDQVMEQLRAALEQLKSGHLDADACGT